MAKIIGNTTTTPMAIPDWNQTDPTKADYIKNKPTTIEMSNIEIIEVPVPVKIMNSYEYTPESLTALKNTCDAIEVARAAGKTIILVHTSLHSGVAKYRMNYTYRTPRNQKTYCFFGYDPYYYDYYKNTAEDWSSFDGITYIEYDYINNAIVNYSTSQSIGGDGSDMESLEDYDSRYYGLPNYQGVAKACYLVLEEAKAYTDEKLMIDSEVVL